MTLINIEINYYAIIIYPLRKFLFLNSLYEESDEIDREIDVERRRYNI